MKNHNFIFVIIFGYLSVGCIRTESKDKPSEETTNSIIVVNPSFSDSIADLSNHNLERIPNEIYAMQNIKKLILSNNSLQSLPDSIAGLKNLIELDLSANQLNSFPESILKLRRLEYLDLSGNNILKTPQSLFQSKTLRFLYLQSNSIMLLPDSLNTPILEELYLNHNGLKNFFKYIGPNRIKVLDLSNNLIEELPIELMNLQKLEVLNASGNQIAFIPKDLPSLPYLSYLFLRGNQIQNFDLNVSLNDSIREIDLSNNPLNLYTKRAIKTKDIFKTN